MKIPLFSFISFVILLFGCGRDSFLVKKRYSNGFYKAHRNKIEHISFSAHTDLTRTKQFIPIAKQENDLPIKCISGKPFRVNKRDTFNPIIEISQNKNSTIRSKIVSKLVHTAQYKGKDLENDFASYGALIIATVMLVVLAKIFGLQFIVAVSFIIAFTVVAAFFLVRIHLNKNPR